MADALRARAEQLAQTLAVYDSPCAFDVSMSPTSECSQCGKAVDVIRVAFEDVTREQLEQQERWNALMSEAAANTFQRAITQGAREQRRLEKALEAERQARETAQYALQDVCDQAELLVAAVQQSRQNVGNHMLGLARGLEALLKHRSPQRRFAQLTEKK